jgi:hypothetical protein
MPFLPEGTTGLDLLTLLIALVGLYLTLRRDRQLGKVGVAMTVEMTALLPNGPHLVVGVVNTERRTVTVEAAGLAIRKKDHGPDIRWQDTNYRKADNFIGMTSDFPLPKTLEPGTPAYPVLVHLRTVKAAFFPNVPLWAWCQDNYGETYWERVPDDVQAAIRAVKRRIVTGQGEWGEDVLAEVEDDVDIKPDDLYDKPWSGSRSFL